MAGVWKVRTALFYFLHSTHGSQEVFTHSGCRTTANWLIQSLKNPLISSRNNQFNYLGSGTRRSLINPVRVLTFIRVNSFNLPPASPLNCHELMTSNGLRLIGFKALLLLPSPRALVGNTSGPQSGRRGSSQEAMRRKNQRTIRTTTFESNPTYCRPPQSPAPIYGFMSPWGIYEKLNDSQSSAEEEAGTVQRTDT